MAPTITEGRPPTLKSTPSSSSSSMGAGGPTPEAPTQLVAFNQEDHQPTTSAPFAEWAAETEAAAPTAFQAACGAAPGYASSAVPYMWGGQPSIPHYGAYNAYGQPAEIVAPDVQGTASPSKSSTNHEMLNSKRLDAGKHVTNVVLSQSGDSGSGSEGSSEESEEDNANSRNAFHQMAMEVLEGNNTGGIFGSCSAPMIMSIPTAGANTGTGTGSTSYFMDYWNGGAPRVLPSRKAKHISVGSQTLVPAMPNAPFLGAASRDGSDLWLQDERELKRQRRKQSNRESARRSRLRKQAECEELSARVDGLAVENVALRTELNRLIEERNNLARENAALMEQVLEKSQEAQQDTTDEDMPCNNIKVEGEA